MYAGAQRIGAPERILLDNDASVTPPPLLAVRSGRRQGGIPNTPYENNMTNTYMKQTTGLTAAVALALAILSGGASAQTPVADMSYVRDARGNVPVSAYGLCWHTGTAPASPTWTAGCDPNPKLVPAYIAMAAEPAPVSKPAAVAAPAPAPVAQKLTFDAD